MKYMVMECHLSYAVVLDEEGRFLKVANRHYEVGQTVTDVIEMQLPQPDTARKKAKRWMYSAATLAACLMLVVSSALWMGQMTYASVYMTINPEIRIDVNREDAVVALEGINEDGVDLIAGYPYKKKDLDLVMDELVDRAIDMGYLHEGGQISLALDADSGEWVISHSDTLPARLNEHLNEKLSVTIEVTDKNAPDGQGQTPFLPEEDDYGESDYGETEPTPQPPESAEPGDSNYGDSGYDDGRADYDGRDEGEEDNDDPFEDEDSREEEDDGKQKDIEDDGQLDDGVSDHSLDGQSGDDSEEEIEGTSNHPDSEEDGGGDRSDDASPDEEELDEEEPEKEPDDEN